MRKNLKQKNSPFHLAPVCAAVLLVFGAHTTQANPLGGNVVSGQASFATNGNTLTVTNIPGTIINWQNFSIQQNEITRFAQQSASSTVLNRVVTNNPSQILGTLQSNGRVFLVNPNGILFGQGATVDVAGMVATTLNLTDADFLAGKHNFSDTPGAQAIKNEGNLTAQEGGEIWLIAPDVENPGIITAENGDIILAAGHEVQILNSLTPNLRVNISAPAGNVTNVGQLIAGAGKLGLFGTVVKNSGTASADSATMQGGKIVFKASQRVEAGGAISASGIGGGRIDILADMENGTVEVSGTLQAAAPQSGDGGFIETSAAHVQIADSARVNTLSANGNHGTWLIDPQDFTVAAVGGDITGAALASSLNSGNVTIQSASGATAGNGDIFVNDSVTKTGAVATTLTLQASRNIEVNSAISSTNATPTALNLVLDHGAAGSATLANSLALAGGYVDVQAAGVSGAGSLNVTGGATTLTGALTASSLNLSSGTLTLNNATDTNLTALTISGGTLGGASNIVLGTGSNFTWSGGTLAGHLTTQGTSTVPSGNFTLGTNALWDNSGSVTITSGGWGYIGANAILNNSGTFDIGNNFGVNFNGTSGAQFNNLLGGTVLLSGNYSAPITGNGGVFNNAGSLIQTSTFTQSINNVINTGNIDVSTGTLNTVGSFTNEGTVNVSGGVFGLGYSGSWNSAAGTINLTRGTLNLGGNFSLSNMGVLTRTGGTVNISNTGVLDNTGGTLDISSTGQFGAGGLGTLSGTILNGTIIGSTLTSSNGTLDNVTIGSSMTESGTPLNINNNLTLADAVDFNTVGSTLNFNGATNGIVLAVGATAATLTQAGGALRAGGNQANVVTIASGVTVQGYGSLNQYYGGSTWINNGMINGNSVGQTLTINPANFTNNGTVSAAAGTVNLTPTTLTLNAGNTLQAAGGVLTINPTNAWSNAAGTINLTAGTLNLGSSFTLADLAGYTRSGGTVNITGALDITGNTLDISGTGQFGTGGLGTLSGTIKNGTIVGTSLTSSSGTLDNITIGSSMTESGTLYLSNNLTLADAVDFNAGASSLYFNGATSSIALAAGATAATLTHAGGVLRAGGDQTNVVTIASGVTVQGYGTLNQYNINSSWVNNGTINGSFNTNIPNFTNNGTLAGIGTVTVGTLTNNGIIAPGVSGADTTGTLSVSGNLLMNAGSSLNIDINSPLAGDYDKLNVSGTTTLSNGATLNLFGWSDIGSFAVVNATGGLSGTFTTTNSGTFTQTPTYAANDLTLAVTANSDTTIYWDGGALTSNWADMLNWSNDVAPTLASNLYIGSGAGTVTVNTTGQSANVLTSDANFTVSAGDLTLAGDSTFRGVTTISGTGTLTGTGAITIASGGTLNMTGGTINGTTLSSLITQTGSTSNVTGGTLGVNRSWNNSGTLSITLPNWTHSGSLSHTAGALNLAGTFSAADMVGITRTGGTVNLTGTLDNTGNTLDIGSAGLFGTGGLDSTSGTIKGGIIVSNDGTVLVGGGTWGGTLDGVTIGSDLTIGQFFIANNLMLASGVMVNKGADNWWIDTTGLQHIGVAGGIGSATIITAGGQIRAGQVAGQTLQIDSGITIQGYGSLNQYSAATVINNGTIIGNTAGQTFTINPTNFTNNGTVSAVMGTVNLTPTTLTLNTGNTLQAAGGTLTINPTNAWSNATGNTNVSAGTLNLGSSFDLAGLGSYTRTGGTVNITGVLDITGNTLDIDGTGQFGAGGLGTLSGSIINGTLIGTTLTSSNGTLDSITIGSSMTESGTLNINNNLTLADAVDFNTVGSTLNFNGATNGIALAAGATAATLTQEGGALRAGGNQTNVVTIGSGVTVQGYGSLNQYYGSSTWINDGTINGNTVGQTLTINPANFINNGTVSAVKGTVNLAPTTLTLNAGNTLQAEGGILTINPTNSWSNAAGTINLTAGTLNLGSSYTLADLAGFIRSGGTVNISGTLDNSGGTLDISSAGQFGTGGLGTLSGTILNGTLIGTSLTSSSGTLDNVTIGSSMTESGTLYISNNLTLADAVDFNTGASSLYFNGATNGIALAAGATAATLTQAGGVLRAGGNQISVATIASGVTVQGYGSLNQYYNNSTWINDGTINGNIDGQTLTINPTNFTNNGIVKATSGTLTIKPTNFTLGAVNTLEVAGGTLNLQPTNAWNNATGNTNVSSGILNLRGNMTVAGLGTFNRTGGIINVAGTLDNTGNTLDIGGTGIFGTGGLSSLGLNTVTGTIVGGTIVSGDATPLYTLAMWSALDGVTLGDATHTSLTATAMTSGTQINNGITLADGFTLNLGSGASWSFSGVSSISSLGASTINLGGHSLTASTATTGSLTIGSGVTLVGNGTLNSATNAAIINNGVIDNNTTSTLSITPTNFTNNGIVSNSATGTLNVKPTATLDNAGTITIAGGTASIGTGTVAWSNAGNIALNAGTLNLGGNFSAAQLASANYTRTAGSFVNIVGTFDNTGSILDIGSAGIFGVGGLSSLNAGTLVGGTLVSNDATVLTLTGLSSYFNGVTIGSDLVANGVINFTQDLILGNGVTFDAGTSIDNFWSTSANIKLESGATSATYQYSGDLRSNVISGVPGTLTIASGVTVRGTGAFNDYYNNGFLVNNGVIENKTIDSANFINNGTVTNTSIGTQTIGGTNFTNNGSVSVTVGTLNVSSTNFTQNGAIDVAVGTTFTRTAGFTNDGTLTGTGMFNVGSNTITNNGIITPGGSDIGLLRITGNLVNGSTGNINLDIGGLVPSTEHDKLQVSGAFTLGGTLNINDAVAYAPGALDVFNVMSSGSSSGSFAAVNVPLASPYFVQSNAGLVWVSLNALATPSTINAWLLDSDGNWNVAANWTNWATPTASDDVVIDRPSGSYTVTVNSGAQVANSLYGAEHLTISGGSLSLGALGGTANLLGNLNLTGGTLTLDGISTLDGAVNLSGGTLAGAGSVTISNGMTMNSGTINRTGTIQLSGDSTWNAGWMTSGTLTNTGTLTFGGAADSGMSTGAAELANSGTIIWNKTSGSLFAWGGILTNQAGGVVDLQSDLTIGTWAGTGGVINNAGTFTKTEGTTTTLWSGITFNHQNGSTFNVANGMAVYLNGGGSFSGTSTGTGVGVTLNGGNWTADAGSSISGTWQWNGGWLNSGTLSNTGTLTFGGAADSGMHGGTAELVNSGTIIWNKSSGPLFAGGGILTNQAGGVVDLQSDSTIGTWAGTGGVINNAGTFTKTVGTATTLSSDITFNHQNGSTFNVANGMTVYLNGGGRFSGTSTGTGVGVTLNGGNWTADAGSSISGTWQWNGGWLNSGTLSNTGTLTFGGAADSGMYGGTAELVNSGTIIWNKSSGPLFAGGGILTNQAGGVVDLQSDSMIGTWAGTGGVINNAGTFTKTTGVSTTIHSTIAFDNTGTVNVQSGDIAVQNFTLNSGTIDVASGTSFTDTTGFTNTGTLTGLGTIVVGTGVSKLVNQGNINPGGTGTTGTLSITGDLQLSTGSNLNIDLGGATAGLFDVLAVSGALTGNAGSFGNLNLNETGGFFTVSGNSFPLVTAASLDTANIFSPFSITDVTLASTYNATSFTIDTTNIVTRWNTDADGNWATVGNWTRGLAGATDTAVIDRVSANPTVTLNTVENVGSLVVGSGETFSMTGGSLTLNGASTVSNFSMSGGTLDGSGDLTVTDNFYWSSGAMSGAGSTIIANTVTAGEIVALVPGYSDPVLTRVLQNSGTISQHHSGLGGSLVINAGGGITNSGTYMFTTDNTDISGTGGFITNTGTFGKSGGVGANNISAAFTNNGGTLNIANGWLNSSAGVSYSGNGNLTGTMVMSGGTATAGGTLAGTGTVQLSGGTMTVDAAGFTTQGYTQTGGILDGSGDLTVTNNFYWSSGTMTGAGSTLIANTVTAGEIVASVPGYSDPILTRFLQNSGTISQHHSGLGGSLVIDAGGSITNSGTYLFTTDNTDISGTGGTITNTGTFGKSGGVGANNISAAFTNNNGNISIASGWLNDSAGFTHTGTGNITGTFVMSGGTGTVSGTLGGTGTLELTGGTLTVGAGGFTTPGYYQIGGILDGALGNDLTVTTTFDWLSGTMQGEGNTIVGAGVTAGNIVTNLGGYSSPILTRTLINNGTISQHHNGIAGNLTINTGGVLDNRGSYMFSTDNADIGGTGGQIINSGIFGKSGGSSVNNISAAFTNNNGNISIAGSGWLNDSAGFTHTGTGNITGTFVMSGGTGTVSGTLGGTGTLELTGGTLTVGAGGFTTPGYYQIGGILDGALGNDLTVTTTFDWLSGTMQGEGNTIVGAGVTAGNIVTNLGAYSSPILTRILINNGTISQHHNGVAGNLTINSGGVLDNRGSYLFSTDNADIGGTGGQIINSGIFGKSGGSSVNNISAAFTNNNGNISIASGWLNDSAGFTHTGTGNITGTFVMSGGTGTVSGTLGGTGTLELTGGTLTVGAGGFTTPGYYQIGGILDGALGNDLTVTTTFDWLSGTMQGEGNTIVGAGVTAGNIVTNLGGYSSPILTRTLINNGTMSQHNAGIAGNLTINTGGVLDNRGSYMFSTDNADINGTGGQIINSGIFGKSGGSLVNNISASLVNTGLIDVGVGTLSVDGTFAINSGTIRTAAGTAFSHAGGFTNAGTLEGFGTVSVGAGNTIINTGNINPGGTGVTGTLSIAGNLQLAAGSNLNMDLGGINAGEYDVLAVSGDLTGNASSFGSANLAETGGFLTLSSNVFPLISAATVEAGSSFSVLTLNDVSFSTSYNATNITIATLGAITRWNTDLSGDWSIASNWTRGLAGANDMAVIDRLSANPVVTVSGNQTVGILSVGSGDTLEITGGSLTVNNSANFSSNAALNLYGGSLWGAGSITLDAGSLATQTEGTLGIDTFNLSSGATYNISNTTGPNASYPFFAPATFNNSGTVNWNGSNQQRSPTLVTTFNNLSGGQFNIQNDMVWDTCCSGGTLVFNNLTGATVSKTSAGTTTFSGTGGSGGITFNNNGGTLDIAAGTLVFGGVGGLNVSGGSVMGAGNLTVNNALSWTGGTFDNTSTLTNGGTFDFLTGGTFNGSLTNNGLLNVSGNSQIGQTFSNGTGGLLTLNDGTLAVAQAFTNAGTINTSGASTLASGTDFTNSGTITAANGSTQLTVQSGGSVILNGTINTNAANFTVYSDTDGANGGNIRMETGAILNTAGGNILFAGGVNGLGAATGVGAADNALASGIYLNGATLDAGTGNIVMRGTGIAAAVGSGSGIYFTNGSMVQTASLGTITLEGVGGGGVSDGNSGVRIGTNSAISAVDGAISLTGNSGASTGSLNMGVYVHNAASITTTGAGSITLSGIGGSTTGGSNRGVRVSGATLTSNSGDLNLDGTGGYDGDGVQLVVGAVLQSTSGNINVTGTSGAGNGNDFGIWVSDLNTLLTTGGNISLSGHSASVAGTGNNGLGIQSSAQIVGTGASNIFLSGTTNSSGDGFQLLSGAQVLAGNGTIDVYGDSTNGDGLDYGAWIDGAGTLISGSGNIAVIATSGALTGTSNRGLVISNTAGINAQGAASITLDGTGGMEGDGLILQSGSTVQSASGGIALIGTSGDGTGNGRGINLNGTGTSVSSAAGDIAVIGDSIVTTGSGNYGVMMSNGAGVNTGGNLTVLATTATTGNLGISLSGKPAAAETLSANSILLSSVDGTSIAADASLNSVSLNTLGDVVNDGQIAASSSLTILSGNFDNNGAINLSPSATATVVLGSTLNNIGSITTLGAPDATVINAGTYNQTGSLSGSLDNSGTASLGGMTTGNVNNSGALALNASSVSGTLDNNGAGTVTTSGSNTVGGAVTNASTAASAFNVAALSTLNATNGITNNAGSALVLDGTIGGALTNAGTYTQTGIHTGNTNNSGNATFGGTTTGDITNTGTATLANTTTGNVTNSGALAMNYASVSGTLGNTGTGTVTTFGNSTVGGAVTNDSSNANAFNVAAASSLTATTGITNNLGSTLNLDGTLGGTLTNAGAFTQAGSHIGNVSNSGTATIGGATTGDISNTGSANLAGTTTGNVNNTGALTLSGVNVSGTLDNTGMGTVTVATSNSSTVGGAITNTSTAASAFNVSSIGILNATTGITNSLGSALVLDGALSGVITNVGNFTQTGAHTGALSNSGTANLGGTTTGNINNTGTATLGGTTTGNVTNAGSLALNAASVSGTLDNTGTGTVTTSGNNTVDSTISNASTAVNAFNVANLSTLNTTSGITNNIGSALVLDGTLGGALTNAGTFTQTGIHTGNTSNSGTATIGGTTTGDIANTGTATLNGTTTGSVTNSGALALNAASVSGTLGNAVTGMVTTSGNNTVVGAVTNASTAVSSFSVAALSTLNATSGITNNAGSGLVLDGTLGGALTNAGTFTQTGIHTGNTSNSGNATIGGTTIGDIASTGTASLGGTTTGNVSNSGSLALNDAAVSGTLGNTGTGTVTTSGSNTVGGAVTNASTAVSAFSVAALSTLNATTGITNNAGSALVLDGTLGGSLINAGTYTQTGIHTGNTINSGNATFGGSTTGDIANTGTSNLSGTTTGNVTNSGALALNAATVSGILDNTGTGTVTTSGSNTVGGAVTNASTAASAFNVAALSTLNAATGITNNAGSALVLDGTLGGAVTNAGTFTQIGIHTGNTNNSGNATIGGTSTGDIANTGTASLGGTTTGNVTNTGALALNAASVSGTLGNTGTGTVTTSGNNTVGGAVTNASTAASAFNVAALSTLNATTGITNNAGSALVLDGTLGGALTNAGTYTQIGIHTGNTNNSGNATFSGTTTGDIANTGTASLGGTTTGNVSNSGVLALNAASVSGTLGNTGTGTVSTAGSNTVGGAVTNASTAASAFNVAALSTLSTTTGITNNAGSALVLDGTLGGALTNAGTYTQTGIHTGNTSNSGNAIFSGSTTGDIANTGTATLGGMTTGNVTNSGVLALNAASVSGTLGNTGTGTVSTAGSNTVGGAVTNASTAASAFSVANLSTLNATTGITNNAGSTLVLEGSLGGALTNAGTFTQTGIHTGNTSNSGNATIGGTTTGNVTNSGALALNAASVSGTLGNTGTGTVTTSGSNTVGGVITNASTAASAFNVASLSTLNATSGITNNAGSDLVLGGTLGGALTNAGTYTQTGIHTGNTSNSGTATLGGTTTGNVTNTGTASLVGITTGNVSNDGAITLDAATVNGALDNHSAGTLATLGMNTVSGLVTNDSLVDNGFDIGSSSSLLANSGVTNQSGANMNLDGALQGDLTNVGTYTQTGIHTGNNSNTGTATLGGTTSGNVSNAGVMTFNDIAISGTLGNDGSLNVMGGATVDGQVSNFANGLMNIGGGLASALNAGAGLDNAGVINLGDPSSAQGMTALNVTGTLHNTNAINSVGTMGIRTIIATTLVSTGEIKISYRMKVNDYDFGQGSVWSENPMTETPDVVDTITNIVMNLPEGLGDVADSKTLIALAEKEAEDEGDELQQIVDAVKDSSNAGAATQHLPMCQ